MLALSMYKQIQVEAKQQTHHVRRMFNENVFSNIIYHSAYKQYCSYRNNEMLQQ